MEPEDVVVDVDSIQLQQALHRAEHVKHSRSARPNKQINFTKRRRNSLIFRFNTIRAGFSPPPPPPASKMLINRLIRSSFKIQSNRPPLLAIFALSRVDLNALRCDNPIELFAWNSNSSRTLFRTQQSPFQVPHGPTVQGQHQGRHRKNKQLDET